jgi:hypothetical protein
VSINAIISIYFPLRSGAVKFLDPNYGRTPPSTKAV